MKNEEIIRGAIISAAANIGGKRLLADCFGLKGCAVSLWLARASFPARYVKTISYWAGEGYEAEKLVEALRKARKAREEARKRKGHQGNPGAILA